MLQLLYRIHWVELMLQQTIYIGKRTWDWSYTTRQSGISTIRHNYTGFEAANISLGLNKKKNARMRMTSRHFGQTLFQDEFTEIRGKKRIRCKIEVILSIWYVDNLIWLNIKVDKNYSKCVRTKDLYTMRKSEGMMRKDRWLNVGMLGDGPNGSKEPRGNGKWG